MKMAKASQADLKMALELANLLEGFERGHFPEEDDGEYRTFDIDDPTSSIKAMDMILEKLREGSLFRVAFGMNVLLDPKNQAIDHSLDYLDHHPKIRMHDELVAALRFARSKVGGDLTATEVMASRKRIDNILAKAGG